LLILRGILALLFGVLSFVWPSITLLTLVILFGAYSLINGILVLSISFKAPKGMPGKGTMVFLGLLGVAAGILTFFYPNITALSLLLVIAWWAIATGVFEIATAIKLRKQVSNEWLLILSGALSVLFGVLVIAMPNAGALSVVWVIGIYAVLFGILLLSLAAKLKGLTSPPQAAARPA